MGNWESYIIDRCPEVGADEAIVPVRQLPIGQSSSVGELLQKGPIDNISMEKVKINGADHYRCYEYAKSLIDQFGLQNTGTIGTMLNGFQKRNIGDHEFVERVTDSMWVCAVVHNNHGKIDFMMACLQGYNLGILAITAHLINNRMIGYSKSKREYFYKLENYNAKIERLDVFINLDVFISYQWDHQEVVKKIKTSLVGEFKVGMDVDMIKMGDNLFEVMEKGIRATKIVIMCISGQYAKSENCKKEADLSAVLRKPIIPLLMSDVEWPPEGLGAIVGGLLYKDFRPAGDSIQFDRLMIDLKRTIKHKINSLL